MTAPDGSDDGTFRMSTVVFSPEVIEIMSVALEASINSLPEPVSATQVHYLAESILRTAETGERDIAVLRRIAQDLGAVAVGEDEAAFFRKDFRGHARMGGKEEAVGMQPVVRPFAVDAKILDR